MSETCSWSGCGRSPTGGGTDDVDHTEAPPDDPCSREANLTPIARRRTASSLSPR